MPSLQIRDLPDHLYRILSEKARRNRRSLAQQATVELERIAEADSRSRRLAAVAELRDVAGREPARATTLDPAAAVREDRER